jgi:hypothetical protein
VKKGLQLDLNSMMMGGNLGEDLGSHLAKEKIEFMTDEKLKRKVHYNMIETQGSQGGQMMTP